MMDSQHEHLKTYLDKQMIGDLETKSSYLPTMNENLSSTGFRFYSELKKYRVNSNRGIQRLW